MGGFVPTLTNYDAASNVVGVITNLAVPVMQRIFLIISGLAQANKGVGRWSHPGKIVLCRADG